MATSIKVSETSKERLDRIQAKITLTQGRKVSLNDLIDALIRVSLDHEEELLEAAIGASPKDDGDVDALLSMGADWGVETRHDEIDEALYGPRRRDRP